MAVAPVIPIRESLIEITDHLYACFDTLDLTEEGSPERAALLAEIEQYVEKGVRKVDNICEYLGHCQAQQEFAAAEIKRLQARKSAFARKAELVESAVERVMDMTGQTKLTGRTATLSLKKCPPSVEVVDPAQVPEEFVKVKVEEVVDKALAAKALKAGNEIPGLRLVTDKRTVVRS